MKGVFIIKKGQDIKHLINHMKYKHVCMNNINDAKEYILSEGYYRGYKAYRFISYYGVPLFLNFVSINEIKLIQDLDDYIKDVFYSLIMQFETSLKSYTLSIIAPNDGNSSNIDFTFRKHILSTKDLFNVLLSKSVKLKDMKHLYESIGYNRLIRIVSNIKHSSYVHNKIKLYNKLINAVKYNMDHTILRHFRYDNKRYHKYFDYNLDVPIWVVFAFITLGNLGYFLKNIDSTDRLRIQKEIGVYDTSHDANGSLLYKYVFELVHLRNFIAHNGVVFDCRFNRNAQVPKGVISCLCDKTGIKNINFYYIEDYLILLIFCLCHFDSINIKYYKCVINNFEYNILKFRNNMSMTIGKYYSSVLFNLIFGDNVFNKLNKMYHVVSLNDFTNNRNMIS